MDRLEAYKIDLKGMQADVETRQLQCDDAYFEAVEATEVKHGNVQATATIRQTAGAFELSMQFAGEVEVQCDRCLEPMPQPVEGEATLRVKLGDEDADDGELIVVNEADGTLDFSWLLYEQIALQIPIRHVHPDGQCTGPLADALNQGGNGNQSETADGEDGEPQATDPRWDALKQLLTTNK